MKDTKSRIEARARRRIFLENFLKTGNISKACEAAGVTRVSYYAWLRRYPSFRKEIEEAQEKFLDSLEESLYKWIEEKKDAKTLLEVLKIRGRHRGWGHVIDINPLKPLVVEFVDKKTIDEGDDASG